MTLTAADGTPIFVHQWEPSLPPKAVVQISHGLAEHAGRYAGLAAALNAAGYSVYGHDHRGHGRTAAAAEDLGFFAEKGGWQKCLDDLGLVNRCVATDHPGLPVVLLGHSMGSFLAQQWMSENGASLAGVVLSATDGRPSLLASIGRLVARMERLRLGPRGRSALIYSLAFGAFNRAFAPTRTAFDWLSRDSAEVDAYIADPRCGFHPSVQLWIDLLDALPELAQPTRYARIPRRLPILLLSGARDPVSRNTAGVTQLLSAYRAAGLDRVTHRFYAEARHELFHEVQRDEVTRDLIAWLDEVVAGGSS